MVTPHEQGKPAAPPATQVLHIRLVAGAGSNAQAEENIDFTSVVEDPIRDDEILLD